MHAYKIRPDETYAPPAPQRPVAKAQPTVAAVADDIHVAPVESPALALQKQLHQRLTADDAAEWIPPGRRVMIVAALALLAWVPVAAGLLLFL